MLFSLFIISYKRCINSTHDVMIMRTIKDEFPDVLSNLRETHTTSPILLVSCDNSTSDRCTMRIVFGEEICLTLVFNTVRTELFDHGHIFPLFQEENTFCFFIFLNIQHWTQPMHQQPIECLDYCKTKHLHGVHQSYHTSVNMIVEGTYLNISMRSVSVCMLHKLILIL